MSEVTDVEIEGQRVRTEVQVHSKEGAQVLVVDIGVQVVITWVFAL